MGEHQVLKDQCFVLKIQIAGTEGLSANLQGLTLNKGQESGAVGCILYAGSSTAVIWYQLLIS